MTILIDLLLSILTVTFGFITVASTLYLLGY
jgi:hypothetical protein